MQMKTPKMTRKRGNSTFFTVLMCENAILLPFLCVFFCISLIFASCGSVKHSSEKQEHAEMTQKSYIAGDLSAFSVCSLAFHTNNDEVSTFEAVFFDTSRYDSTTNTSPIAKIVRGERKKNEKGSGTASTNKDINQSYTQESTASKNTSVKQSREAAAAETKMPFYLAFMVCAGVLAVLVGILAYWVFSKYRGR